MPFKQGEVVMHAERGQVKIVRPLAPALRDSDAEVIDRYDVLNRVNLDPEPAVFGKFNSVVWADQLVSLRTKKVRGDWSVLHLLLAETSYRLIREEYALTGKPVREIGSAKWARQVYAAAGIEMDKWTSTPTTFPQFLIRDGYVTDLGDGNYIPTGKAWDGMRNKHFSEVPCN